MNFFCFTYESFAQKTFPDFISWFMEDDIDSCTTTQVILLPCMWKMITYWLLHLPIKNAGVYAQILGKMHKSIWQKLAQIHIKALSGASCK
jgi:hypothetical protein